VIPALRAFVRLCKGEIPGGEITTIDMVRARLPYFVWPDRTPVVSIDIDLSDLDGVVQLKLVRRT